LYIQVPQVILYPFNASISTTITLWDTLIGGIGKSGTALNLGVGNFLTTPDITINSSQIRFGKTLNMTSTNISNVANLFLTNLAPTSPSSNISVSGNLTMSGSNITSVGTISTANLNPVSSNIVVGGNFNLSNHYISNVLTLSSASVETQNTDQHDSSICSISL